MNSGNSTPSRKSSRCLFFGISVGFVVASGLIISLAYFDPQWLVWLARGKAIIGGALALVVALVFFSPHLNNTAAKTAAIQTNQTSEGVVGTVSELRDQLRTRPFLAGALGAYPLAALVTEQLVSATPSLQQPEISPLWTLAGIALCASGLTWVDTGRTQPAVASAFVLAMAIGAAAAVFSAKGQSSWSTASAVAALVLLAATALRRFTLARRRSEPQPSEV